MVWFMEAEEVEKIPRGNLRVARADFAEVWRAGEELGHTESFGSGVAHTCRWMACALSTLNGRRLVSMAPITHTMRLAHEELIEREYLAAEQESIRLVGSDDEHRVAFVEGARATLRWAWKGLGSPPVDIRTNRGAS